MSDATRRPQLTTIGSSEDPEGSPQQTPDDRATSSRYPRLLGFYGVATVLVVVYDVYQHMRTGPRSTYPYQGRPWHELLLSLDTFVGMFFLVSAFLLGLPYARAALDAAPPTSGRVFLFRRAVRLLPLYLVAILVVWTLRNQSFPGDWKDLVEHLTFTQVFDDKRIFFTIGPAWSLAVEVQFSLLLVLAAPAVCRKCRRLPDRSRRLRVLLMSVGGLAAVSVAWKLLAYVVFDAGETSWWVWFGLPAKVDIFAVGLLLAVAVAALAPGTTMTTGQCLRLGALGVVVFGVAVFARARFSLPTYVYFHTLAALGFGLVVAAFVLAPTRPAVAADRVSGRLTATSGLTLGLTSYSLYLWHEPVMLFLASHHLYPQPGTPHSFSLGVLILLPVAALFAWLSYWIIEYPTGMLRRTRGLAGIKRNYYSDN